MATKNKEYYERKMRNINDSWRDFARRMNEDWADFATSQVVIWLLFSLSSFAFGFLIGSLR